MEKEVYKPLWQELLATNLEKAKRPLLVILGPTASGKTAFSLEVAKWITEHPLPSSQSSPNGRGRPEIINADSRQLYKHMDIGTAKITPEEMEGIPHHLFSVLDPREKVTVGWYKQAAGTVIDDVLARGNIPILVGGSMLYISAVTEGYVFTGRGGKHVAPVPYDLLMLGLRWPRGELVKRIGERTEKLLGMDCVTLPFEALKGSQALNGRCEQQRATKGDTRYMVRGSTRSRAPHHDKQKNPRTWLQEVEWLLQHGYRISDPGMESHGYRSIAQWILEGKKQEEMQDLLDHINAVTRQYAKRQVTWWRHDTRIHWLYADDVACRP